MNSAGVQSQRCLQDVISEEMLLQTLPGLPLGPPPGLGPPGLGFLIGMSLHIFIATVLVRVSIAEQLSVGFGATQCGFVS